jgi:hypothetical protein
MRPYRHILGSGLAVIFVLGWARSTIAFEGRINAVITQDNETNALLYTVGTNFLRVEMTATKWPNPVDILDRNSGALTLLFPHNRSCVRLKPVTETSSMPPGFPQMPGGLPPGVGPQPALAAMPGAPHIPALPNRPAMPAPPAGLPPGIGSQAPMPNAPGVRAMPQMPGTPGMGSMPAMPIMQMPMQQVELKAAGEKTNLLGFACEKFEIKQRGETMEIWTTDQLLPYQLYVRNQPHRFGPRMIEEQWGALLTAQKSFPLRASLCFDNGAERFRFEVKAAQAEKIADPGGKLFQPPPDYREIEPLPI